MDGRSPKRGGAPARATLGLDGISIADRTGWTVFRIPGSPGPIPSVQTGLCGSDNSETVSYLHQFIYFPPSPPLVHPSDENGSPRAAAPAQAPAI